MTQKEIRTVDERNTVGKGVIVEQVRGRGPENTVRGICWGKGHLPWSKNYR